MPIISNPTVSFSDGEVAHILESWLRANGKISASQTLDLNTIIIMEGLAGSFRGITLDISDNC